MRTVVIATVAALTAGVVADSAGAEKRIAPVVHSGGDAQISPPAYPLPGAELTPRPVADDGDPIVLAAADRRAVIRSIQTALSNVGCSPGAIDGSWGRRSQRALERFARHAKVALPSELVSAQTLKLFDQSRGRVCPPTERTTVQGKQQQPSTPKKKRRGVPYQDDSCVVYSSESQC